MFRYRYDTETGLYYLNSRYYNADWGRFINADGLVGEKGEILAHNMFAYCANDPINREDPSGYRWGWIKKIYNKVASWFKSVPKSEVTIPESNTVLSNISGAVLGSSESALATQKVNVGYALEGNEIRVAPMGRNELYKFPIAIKNLNKAATVLTVATGSLDVANTWTANNSNTNAKRCEKTAIQLGGVAAGYGVGLLAVAAFNFWNPVGWSILGATALAGTVLFISATTISGAQDELYKWRGIQ